VGTIKVTTGKSTKVVAREVERVSSGNSQPQVSVSNEEIDLQVSGSDQAVAIPRREIESIVLSTGPIGPQGLSAEDIDGMYAERVDFITDSLLYKGWADPGTAESAAEWRIQRIVIGADDDVTKTYPDGSNGFEFAWDDRATLSYS
jgi:hypothetical protein